MSASEPETRISEAEREQVRVGDPLRPASPPPSSSAIVGSATLTTVASTATTAEPRIAATSAPFFPSIAGKLQSRQSGLAVTGSRVSRCAK